MMKEKLSILIVNYNSADFIEISLYAFKKLTKNEYRVFIRDNGSCQEDYSKLKKIVGKYNNVFLSRSNTNLRGSIAHGTALNDLVKKVDTPYFSILDADAVWLKMAWDEVLIGKISDKVKVIGTQASGYKPKDFPLMFAILFETEAFRKLNIDFRPKNIDEKQDTGWELREKYLGAGYRGKVINLKNTRKHKNGPFANILGVGEYYLGDDKSIFASHFGRGSTLGANKYKRGFKKYFYSIPFLGSYLLKKRGLKEKERWISICQKIIDRQV